MKKQVYLLLLFGAIFVSGFAQDDDIYFVPSGAKKAQTQQPKPARISPVAAPAAPTDDADSWANGRQPDRDVDDYNRRYSSKSDTTYSYMQTDDAQDGSCTARLVRFHSPSVGVYVSSPFYADYCDYWFDYGFGLGYYWHYAWEPWYGWGWNRWSYWSPVWWGWHSSYWDYCWGWHYGHHGWGLPAWNVGHRPSATMVASRLTSYRPSREYASNRAGSARIGGNAGANLPRTGRDSGVRISRPSGNVSAERPSRNYSTTGTPRNNNAAAGRPSTSSGYASGRSMGNSSAGMSGRSFGGGGNTGRSFSGARSGGGRR